MPVVEILPPHRAMQPLSDPIIVTDNWAIVPHPRGGHAVAPIGRGIALAWAHAPEIGGVALSQFFVKDSELGSVHVLSRDGLRAYIADLQAIDAQLGSD